MVLPASRSLGLIFLLWHECHPPESRGGVYALQVLLSGFIYCGSFLSCLYLPSKILAAFGPQRSALLPWFGFVVNLCIRFFLPRKFLAPSGSRCYYIIGTGRTVCWFRLEIRERLQNGKRNTLRNLYLLALFCLDILLVFTLKSLPLEGSAALMLHDMYVYMYLYICSTYLYVYLLCIYALLLSYCLHSLLYMCLYIVYYSYSYNNLILLAFYVYLIYVLYIYFFCFSHFSFLIFLILCLLTSCLYSYIYIYICILLLHYASIYYYIIVAYLLYLCTYALVTPSY